ncbi:hypothetical protein [Blautia argi]|uniref:hypothetical protein n=1 Tax=Blautia argi TaxID=1912897 RepID=UPI002941EB89|nr:hypothetical protein [Blautia argi]
MAGVKGRSGGKRPGAGRPPKYNDCPTKVMRVPTYMAGHIRSLLDLADDWVNYAKKPKVCMLDEADEKKRKELVDLMSSMIDYENQRQRELRESAENHKLDKYMIPLFE